MIFFIENKIINGYQSFPYTTNMNHIVVNDEDIETIENLKSVLGYVQLDENDELQDDWYQQALNLKNEKEIDQTYKEKILEVHQQADSLTIGYLSQFSKVEKETWPTQRKEAEAWQADNTAPTPKLDQLAIARGTDRLAFIQKVIDAINTLEDLSFQVVAAQQIKEDELNAAKLISLEALNAVDTTLII